jgi:FtsP/CotA-like multicopper oxidase with cupredoxin domain
MISRRNFLSTGAGIIGASIVSPSWHYTEASDKPYILLEPKPSMAPLAGPHKPAVPVWGYNGKVPGPVVRVKQGSRVNVRLKNSLTQPTTIHWHGVRINNAMDGVPGLTQDAIPPGEYFDYSFIPPDAGTYWYHAHAKSWEQIARGLYGILIVDEKKQPLIDRDIIFSADDWRLNANGQIDEESFGSMHDWSHSGRIGNWLTVNGLTNPSILVHTGERLRVRLVNTANARILAFNFDRLDTKIIALDGQPITPTRPGSKGIVLAPAQRADAIINIDGNPGDRIPIWEVSTSNRLKSAEFVLSNKPSLNNLNLDSPVILPVSELNSKIDLKQPKHIKLIMEGGAMGGLREAYIDEKLISIKEMVENKLFWALNGKAGMQKKPLAEILRGQTTVINLINKTAFSHAMHLHGYHFQVIERNGITVTGSPWRDTELIKRKEQVRIAFIADNPGKWLLHCHMLEHAAAGMIAWINVS